LAQNQPHNSDYYVFVHVFPLASLPRIHPFIMAVRPALFVRLLPHVSSLPLATLMLIFIVSSSVRYLNLFSFVCIRIRMGKCSSLHVRKFVFIFMRSHLYSHLYSHLQLCACSCSYPLSSFVCARVYEYALMCINMPSFASAHYSHACSHSYVPVTKSICALIRSHIHQYVYLYAHLCIHVRPLTRSCTPCMHSYAMI